MVQPDQINLSPDEKEKSESLQKAKAYFEFINDDSSKLEDLKLMADKSVSLKLKDSDETIVFKLPSHQFIVGSAQGEREIEKQIRDISSKSSLILAGDLFLQFGLKYKDFSSEEFLGALIKELKVGYICANHFVSVGGNLNKFIGVEPENFDTASVDQAILNLPNEEVSSKLRLSFLYTSVIRGLSKEKEEKDYLASLADSDPLLIDDLLDYSIRACLTSGHEVSICLFDFLRSKPEFYQKLNENHRNFSLPFLLERDLYNRMLNNYTSDEAKVQLRQEIKDTIEILHFDITAIQKRLGELGSDRKYMPEL